MAGESVVSYMMVHPLIGLTGPIEQVIDRHLTELIQVEGVFAVGYSNDDDVPYTAVSVEELTLELK